MKLAATTKRGRTRKSGAGGGTVGDPDRLSALPDCLLHDIMSFMKARQVVQTCILSSRWRHLWRSVPCLDVDLDEFQTVTRYRTDSDRNWEDFEDFSINLMLHHNIALLDSFRLDVSKAPRFGNERAGTWIRRAMKYCDSSWRLRRLHLCNVFLDDRFARHVDSSCRSLEDLELERCECKLDAITSHSLKNLVLKNCKCMDLSGITSPTLKSLVIDGGWRMSYLVVGGELKNYPLVITAPCVSYLRLAVGAYNMYLGISITEMPSLTKASLHLDLGYADEQGFVQPWEEDIQLEKSQLSGDQFKLVFTASSVTSLELSNLETMVLGEESTTFPEFKNLENLLLDKCDLSNGFQTLRLFLQNSPKLEKLTLRRCKLSNDPTKTKGTSKSQKISSSQCHTLDVQCVNLKLTEIIHEEDEDTRQLVELLRCFSESLTKNYIKLTKV